MLAGPTLCAAGDDEASVRAALDRALAVNSGLVSYVAEVETEESRGRTVAEGPAARSVGPARFKVHWAAPGKQHIERVGAADTGPRRSLLTVDPAQVISKPDMRPAGALARDMLGDREADIASLESVDPRTGTVFRVTMWIDAKESYVLKLRSQWNYTELATTTFQYKKVAGRYWLPSTVETHFPHDDLTVTNRYTYQRVNAPVPPEVSERMR